MALYRVPDTAEVDIFAHRPMEAQQAISSRKLKAKVGKRLPVIIDEAGPTVAKGRSMHRNGEIATT